jgi:hypothetical protein
MTTTRKSTRTLEINYWQAFNYVSEAERTGHIENMPALYRDTVNHFWGKEHPDQLIVDALINLDGSTPSTGPYLVVNTREYLYGHK